jgi:hypothetical protein
MQRGPLENEKVVGEMFNIKKIIGSKGILQLTCWQHGNFVQDEWLLEKITTSMEHNSVIFLKLKK